MNCGEEISEIKKKLRSELRKTVMANPDKFPERTREGEFIFVGANDAINRLRELPEWKDVEVVNIVLAPFMGPAVELALREGKTVYICMFPMKEEKYYIELEPNNLKGRERFA